MSLNVPISFRWVSWLGRVNYGAKTLILYVKNVCNKWPLYYLFPFLTRETYLQSSSKVLGRLPFLPLLFLPPPTPPPAPGPMLVKTLMFVRATVLLYPNIE